MKKYLRFITCVILLSASPTLVYAATLNIAAVQKAVPDSRAAIDKAYKSITGFNTAKDTLNKAVAANNIVQVTLGKENLTTTYNTAIADKKTALAFTRDTISKIPAAVKVLRTPMGLGYLPASMVRAATDLENAVKELTAKANALENTPIE